MNLPYKLFISFSFILFFGIQPFFSQAPLINQIQGSSVHCLPSTTPIQYTVSASNSPTSYTWSVVGSTNVILSNVSNSVCSINFLSPFINTTYTLSCQVSNGNGNSNIESFVINVFEKPSVTFSGSNNICQGIGGNISASSTMFQASSTTISYNWSPSNGLSSTNSASVFANPSTSTNYTVLLTAGVCTETNYFSVIVNPPPIISASLATNPICEGQSTSILLSGNVSVFSINGFSAQAISNLSPTISTQYTLSGTDLFGCVSQPTTITLNVNPAPLISGGFIPQAVCQGESSTLSLTGGAVSYSINSISGTTLSVNPTISTFYNVSGTGSNGCISLPQQMIITVKPPPIINLSVNNSLICNGESVTLTLTGTSVSYSINGSTSSAITILTPTSSTNYSIIGTGSNSCSSSLTQSISVDFCLNVNEYIKSKTEIELFPNPNSGTFTLKSPTSQTVMILNNLGQTVRLISIDNDVSNETVVSGLTEGVYFIVSKESKLKMIVTN